MSPPVHIAGAFLSHVPHAADIGLYLESVGNGEAVMKIDYAEHLVGDPETGVLHGGVITSLLDNASGVAVNSRARSFGSIATLDLRIDYMKPATPGLDVYAWTECYRMTKAIAFVRGVAYHTDRSDPIASVAASFMLGSSDGRKPGANLRPSA